MSNHVTEWLNAYLDGELRGGGRERERQPNQAQEGFSHKLFRAGQPNRP